MVKRSTEPPAAQTAAGTQLTLRHQQRIAAGYLLNNGMPMSQVKESTGFARSTIVQRWADQLRTEGTVDDSPRTGAPRRASLDDAAAVGEELLSDRTGLGVRRAVQRLKARGAISKRSDLTPRTVTRTLPLVGYAVEPCLPRSAPGATEAQRGKRLAFARRSRDMGGGIRWAFSDSKIFQGGNKSYPGMRRAWTNGDARARPKKTSPFQVNPITLTLTLTLTLTSPITLTLTLGTCVCCYH